MFCPKWIAGFAWIGVGAITPVALAPMDAQAAPVASKADRERASAVFTEAETAFNFGDYDLALQKFEAAQTLAFSPVVDFNIAVCLERLGRTQEAAQTYQRVADGAEVPVTVRERARLARLALPPSARATAQPVVPSPLPTVVAPLEEENGLTLARSEPPPRSHPWLGPVGWTGAAALGVGVVAASILWLLGTANRDDYNDPATTDPQRLSALADRADRYDLAFKLSVGLAITGGVAVFLDRVWLHPRP